MKAKLEIGAIMPMLLDANFSREEKQSLIEKILNDNINALQVNIDLSKAQQQYTGFKAHQYGTTIVGLTQEMGLKPEEWKAMKKLKLTDILPERDIKEINLYFKEKNKA